MIKNGPSKWPGANEVDNASLLKEHIIRNKLKDLRYGQVVKRHLIDGDYVFFNRQPSLHRISFMAHKVRVLPHKTFRFNLCVCKPYNADFDGDEMNVHAPQTYMACAEAQQLLLTPQNLLTPKDGTPIIGPLQDFVSASYLLTFKDTFFTKGEVMQLYGFMCDAHTTHKDAKLTIPEPAIYAPIRLWTGKQVFSMLLQFEDEKLDINFEGVSRAGKRVKSEYKKHVLSEGDGYCVFHHGELMCGSVDKGILVGSKNGILFRLIQDYGNDIAAEVLSRLSKLCARFLGDRGFSIGISDVTPNGKLKRVKKETVDVGTKNCYKIIDDMVAGKLEPMPGLSLSETLERRLNDILSQIRDDLGAMCLQTLKEKYNAAVIMAICGSKGSAGNVCQMAACVAQQVIEGKRVQFGFLERTLPHYKPGKPDNLYPLARGFVESSFYDGLSCLEFYFHTVSGREGLVDTAVKTAETGYLQRRVMYALQDSCLLYDHTVRDAENNVIQFSYGRDGLDNLNIENSHEQMFNLLVTKYWHTDNKVSPVLMPKEVLSQMKQTVLNHVEYSGLKNRKSNVNMNHFEKELVKWVNAYVKDKTFGIIEWLGQKLGENLFNKHGSDYSQEIYQTLRNLGCFTKNEFRIIIENALNRFLRCICQPGTPVGAIAAQSIGEPSTQMTLQTFHKAGLGGSITTGIPRINELVNHSQSKVRQIYGSLEINDDEEIALQTKAKLEKTLLGSICRYIKTVYRRQKRYIEILLDKEKMRALRIRLNVQDIQRRIKAHKGILPKRSIRKKHSITIHQYKKTSNAAKDDIFLRIQVEPPDEELSSCIHHLEAVLPKIVVCGYKDIPRVTINSRKPSSSELPDPQSQFYLRNLDTCTGVWERIEDTEGRMVLHSGRPQFHKKYRRPKTDPFREKYKRMRWNNVRKQWEIVKANLDILAYCACDVPHPLDLHGLQPEKASWLHHESGIKYSVRQNAAVEPSQIFDLVIQGGSLLDILSVPNIDSRRTRSMDTKEMHATFGLEAGRQTIINEIGSTMTDYGISLDERHLFMLVDVMTFKGKIHGCTRYGIEKMKDSTLALASFETTVKFLVEGSRFGATDPIAGTVECCILGRPSPGGTGICNVLRDVNLQAKGEKKKEEMSLPTRPRLLLGENVGRHMLRKPFKR